jgi:two-component system, LytTR family, response regulator
MRINSIIIDDEPNNIENIQSILQRHYPEINVVATAANAGDGIAAIDKLKPDLVFLDIQMPGRSGFDLLKAFPRISFEIIFITAYDQYGIQAIKFSALDYLLKPIDPEEFKSAIQKAKDKISSRQTNHSIQNLLEYIKRGQNETPKMALPTLEEIRYVPVTGIVRCQASDNYTLFHLDSGEQVLVCRTLKEYAGLLATHGFVRTHQSHLVNIDFVKSYLKEDGGSLLLKDHTKIPISRQNRDLVKEVLNGGI